MRPLQLFCELLTQWRTDSNGTRIGLEYAAMRAHLEFSVDDAAERKALYSDLRHMEVPAISEYIAAAQEAFEEMQRKNEAARHKPD